MKIGQLRWLILSLSFILLSYGGIVGIWLGDFIPTFSCAYVPHHNYAASCGLHTLQVELGKGTWDGFIAAFLTLGGFSILVIIFGSAWCGWICPAAFIQDLLDLIRRRLGWGYLRFPESVRNRLRPIKWILLFTVLLLPLWVAFPLLAPQVAHDLDKPFCQLCPLRYIMPFITNHGRHTGVVLENATTIIMTGSGVLLAGLTLVGALFKRRFWCAYCPTLLLISFYNRLSWLRLKKQPTPCTHCEICYQVCPMDIELVYKTRQPITQTPNNCCLCLRCIEYCPEDDALQLTMAGKIIFRSTRSGFESRQKLVEKPTKKEL